MPSSDTWLSVHERPPPPPKEGIALPVHVLLSNGRTKGFHDFFGNKLLPLLTLELLEALDLSVEEVALVALRAGDPVDVDVGGLLAALDREIFQVLARQQGILLPLEFPPLLLGRLLLLLERLLAERHDEL